MASRLYNQGALKLLDRTVDYASDNIAVLLVDNNYSFDISHEFVSNISGEAVNDTGSGYARVALEGKDISLNASANAVVFDSNDVSYTAISTTNTLAGAVLYKDTGSDATSDLVAFIDFADLTTNGSDVDLQINANGLFRVINTAS